MFHVKHLATAGLFIALIAGALVSVARIGNVATPALAQQGPWYGGPSTGTGYPNGSTPVTASTAGTTAAISATLPGVAGKTTFICGFAMTAAGGNSGAIGNGTITGTISGTLNFAFENPMNGQGIIVVPFLPCIPASAPNTAIVINQPAAGSGAIAAVTAWGYQSGT